MAELEQFDEAKRLLMEVTECNGICPPEKNTNACGCSRWVIVVILLARL